MKLQLTGLRMAARAIGPIRVGPLDHASRPGPCGAAALLVMLTAAATGVLGCGTAALKPQATAPRKVAAPTSGPTAATTTPSASTASSHATVSATASTPGTVLLTATQADDLCASQFGPQWQTLSASDGGYLLPGGHVALACGNQNTSGGQVPVQLVLYDLIAHRVTWRLDVSRDATDDTNGPVYFFGSRHLFLISSHTTPATGLQAASTAYTLEARDLATGAVSWTADMGTDAPTSDTSVTEGPSGVPGHPQDAVIAWQTGTAAFDASTGESLWHTKNSYGTPASGSYITDGVVEVNGYQDNEYNQHLTGFSAATDKQIWDLRYPECQGDTNGTYLTGTAEWEFSESCFEEHNVATGKLIADRQFPSTWQHALGDPQGVMGWDGAKLSFYVPADLSTPVWSVPAGETTPQAISAGHSLVEAPSGEVILDNTNGSITAHVPASFNPGNGLTDQVAGGGVVVDGLVESIAQDGETSVLELDPPSLTLG